MKPQQRPRHPRRLVRAAGYGLTGQVSPFPYDDARFGVPSRPDLAFVTLAKILTTDA